MNISKLPYDTWIIRRGEEVAPV